MFKSTSSYPNGPHLRFPLWDVKGHWISKQGGPRIRLYRNTPRKDGAYYLELAYNENDVFRMPIKKDWTRLFYVDFYGWVGLAYDPERDVLSLSHYGEYYRADD